METETSEYLQNYTAPLLEGKLRFGSYPSSDLMKSLVEVGVSIFVDLTDEHDRPLIEKLGIPYPYRTPPSVVCLKHPIADRTPGDRESMLPLVAKCVNTLLSGGSVYVHCRGGHGRSAVIAAIIMIEMGYSNQESLRLVREAHLSRKIMDEKWRAKGAPQTISQKTFVKKWSSTVN